MADFDSNRPVVGGDNNTWGDENNDLWDDVQAKALNKEGTTTQTVSANCNFTASGSNDFTNDVNIGGSLGIGTNTPTGKLNVVDSSDIGIEFEEIGASIMRIMSFDRVLGQEERLQMRASEFQISTNNLERVTVKNSGDVQFLAYGAGTLVTDASGNITASSDESLKDIKSNFSKGLDEILGLNPIVYKWREETGFDTKNEYVGLSAQNVKEFIPEATFEDKNGKLTLQDRPIIVALINAVKELKEEVEQLK